MKLEISKILFIFLLLVFVVTGGTYFYIHRWEESTDDAVLSGHAVNISPKIAGYVKVLHVNDNQFVKLGDVLLEIDPTDYLIRRDKAKAVYEAARLAAFASRSQMETINITAPSNRDAAKAQVDSASANVIKAENDLNRMNHLSNEARSQVQYDQAIMTKNVAKASLYEAIAKLRSAETAPKAISAAKAYKDQLSAQFKQAEADLAQAENDLTNTKLFARMDGKITNLTVERGDYVQTGQYLSSLVGTEIWVTANFKETQIENMRPGQSVKISIDAFPNLHFEGKIDSIQSGTGAFFSAFPPQNATGNFVKIVQRVPVKIVFTELPNTSLALGPGLSVVPIVNTGIE